MQGSAPREAWHLSSPLMRRAIYALKVALTVVLTLFVAFMFNLDHTYWALMTVPLIVRPEAGTMVWRSTARLAGTFAGGLAGCALALSFAQSPVQAIGGLALFLLLVGYLTRMQSGIDAYGYATGGFTALVITISAATDPTLAWPLTLARLTETMIPIFCGFVVMLVVFPRSVTDNAGRSLQAARGVLLGFTGDVLKADHAPPSAPEREVMVAIGAAHTDLRSLVYERSRKGWRRPGMADVAHAMDRLTVAVTALRFAQEDAPGAAASPVRAELLTLVEALAAAQTAAERVALGQRADRLTVLPEGPQPIPKGRLAAPGDVVARCLALVALRLRELAWAEALLADPEGTAPQIPARPARRPSIRRYRDHVAALQNGARPAIMLILMSIAWLGTGWSAGSSIVTIVPALTLLLPTIVPRAVRVKAGQALTLGLTAGLVIGLALMMALNHVEGFVALALLLGAAVFVIFFLAGELQLLPLAIGSMIMISVGLQFSNTPNFDPLTLFNAAAGLFLLPPCFIAALTILFPEDRGWLRSHLRRGTTRLMTRAATARSDSHDDGLDEMIDMFTDYGPGLSTDLPQDAALIRRARGALVASLCCHDLRRQEASMPAGIARHGPALRAAAWAAVRGRGVPDAPFASLAAALGPVPDDATRRYAEIAELLRSIISRHILSPNPKEGP
ncbi:FUSC family protein [Falsirhodobacter algicola]|uniref:FUSC family protein n=1 Tax=Falsirhodobacter algicola TaxID=2692330 RepID=A0A8J8SK10_9RHOB|nr:FUSC family protein [Falsirhodobacter algicola]QUS34904.1 hypothetical protein GR316_00625 [Falsirhodobacter algicola]